jgi:hypothetical protein
MQKMQEIAGSFDHNGDGSVQSRVHHPMKHIKGFTRSHQMPPSGKCLRCIALAADVAVIFVENIGRPKPKVMRILGRRGHWSICVFVLYLYQNIDAKKMEYRMKIHKTASEQLFSGSFTLFFCIGKPLQISN